MSASKKTFYRNPAPRPAAPSPQTPVAPRPVGGITRRRPRLILGTALLLSGAFLLLAIVSYFFTWQADQNLISGGESTTDYLLRDHNEVENWGGRLGAMLAHALVFRRFGIASVAIGLWLLIAGVQMLYGKRALPVMRYLRWGSLLILLAAPVLAYVFPDSAFPWGGALGTAAVSFSNGLIGFAGTGMALLALGLLTVFLVFALDVRPLLRRVHLTTQAAYKKVAPTPGSGNAPVAPENPLPVAEKVPQNPSAMDTVIVADPTRAVPDNSYIKPLQNLPQTPEKENPLKLHTVPPVEEKMAVFPMPRVHPEKEERSAFSATPDVLEMEPPVEILSAESSPKLVEEEPSLEVVQVHEKPAAITIKHGAHISVAQNEPYAPELDLPDYKFPTLDLLQERGQQTVSLDTEELEKNKSQIIQTLRSFGIEIQRISATVGPTVTLYEIVPAEGVRISKIRNLEDDIALNLAALGIRIIAPIPGKGTIGIEVPNAHKQMVPMRALLASEKFVNAKMSLPVALGKTISNENYIVDLATMPHLLMAGATGQGKSVGINAILVSLLYKKHPSQLKFVMVDPKKVELSIYKMIEKHFLAKLPNEEEAIITDTKKVIYTLNALCIEMDNRYELLKEAGTRNIKEYNDKFMARRLNPERGHKYLPFIVLVVDEFADLIMTAGKEVEMPIARLAQLARAVGIHLIIATQRPSVNVITGTIKANFPARMAFKVSAKVDSRTILDTGGAEQLVGRGDMLVSHGSELLRLQCAFVDTPEVENIVEFIGAQRGYPSAFELPEYEGADDDGGSKEAVDLSNRDKLFSDCAHVVVQTQSGSTSMLQRRFNLGYNRAGRIMDQLEAAGIVGAASGSKPRDVLYHTEAELEEFLQRLG